VSRGEEDKAFGVKNFKKKQSKKLRRGGATADHRAGGAPASSLHLPRRLYFFERRESFSL